jgi:hypothetical protein
MRDACEPVAPWVGATFDAVALQSQRRIRGCNAGTGRKRDQMLPLFRFMPDPQVPHPDQACLSRNCHAAISHPADDVLCVKFSRVRPNAR